MIQEENTRERNCKLCSQKISQSSADGLIFLKTKETNWRKLRYIAPVEKFPGKLPYESLSMFLVCIQQRVTHYPEKKEEKENPATHT